MVEVCTILHNKPAYLILDETFDGMDEESVLKAGGMIRHLVKEGTGVLLVSYQYHGRCVRVLQVHAHGPANGCKPLSGNFLPTP
ncbi:P-loop NTPase family protein [Pleomorphovibrio marinus]|uniref:hypothetical protein n=1 Tax=Pleomorphovibrio marinus TaxID=2164132 RepID=UPI000E0C37DC|nr:hypothetical protein [Pleomorphovibrio marinus]